MTVQSIEVPAGYRAARAGAVVYDENDVGRIVMRGRDRAALLQRLTTNDVERLAIGEGCRTVLTTPIGRIIDVLTVYARDDSLLLITSRGQGPLVFGHLRKNIFFNDQVTLEPAGRSHGQLALFGPAATELLARLAGESPAALALHGSVELPLAGAVSLVARREPLGGDGYTLLIPVDALEAVRAAILAGGAVALDEGAFDVLRVEQGYPLFGRELSQEYIPLETGLRDAVSFSKGCYVGQEIIARMDSRNRLAKQLRGLRFTDDAAAQLPPLPAKLALDGKEAGDLTSVVQSPRLGAIGLAYVRTAHAEPGTMVGIAGTSLQAEVVELPFDK